jgi:hypothetical protein
MPPIEIPSTPLVEFGKVRLLGSKDALKRLQNAIDSLTRKAMTAGKFTEDEKTFLVELFECFSLGGRVMGYSEASKLANHYVHGKGKLLKLDEEVYSTSVIVQDVQVVMKRQIQISLRQTKGAAVALSSADSRLHKLKEYQALIDKKRNVDTQGRLLIGGWLLTEQNNQRLQKANNRFQLSSVSQLSDKQIITTWRVDDEYVFEPFSKGYYTDITLREHMALRMPDGLSQYMTKLGIANAFKHYAKWTEVWTPVPEEATTPAKIPPQHPATRAKH